MCSQIIRALPFHKITGYDQDSSQILMAYAERTPCVTYAERTLCATYAERTLCVTYKRMTPLADLTAVPEHCSDCHVVTNGHWDHLFAGHLHPHHVEKCSWPDGHACRDLQAVGVIGICSVLNRKNRLRTQVYVWYSSVNARTGAACATTHLVFNWCYEA